MQELWVWVEDKEFVELSLFPATGMLRWFAQGHREPNTRFLGTGRMALVTNTTRQSCIRAVESANAGQELRSLPGFVVPLWVILPESFFSCNFRIWNVLFLIIWEPLDCLATAGIFTLPSSLDSWLHNIFGEEMQGVTGFLQRTRCNPAVWPFTGVTRLECWEKVRWLGKERSRLYRKSWECLCLNKYKDYITSFYGEHTESSKKYGKLHYWLVPWQGGET